MRHSGEGRQTARVSSVRGGAAARGCALYKQKVSEVVASCLIGGLFEDTAKRVDGAAFGGRPFSESRGEQSSAAPAAVVQLTTETSCLSQSRRASNASRTPKRVCQCSLHLRSSPRMALSFLQAAIAESSFWRISMLPGPIFSASW